MASVTITWKAFGNRPERDRYITSVSFDTEFNITDKNIRQFLDIIYSQTNVYAGNLWNLIEPLLSEHRTHTALSVGDEVMVNGTIYRIADFGWDEVAA